MSNQGGVYTWSKTATANASADNTVNYQEGQAPSSLNDSARAAMASVAKYRDDISGALVTTGSAAAYMVASNQNFDTLADFNGQVIAFAPHVTNAAGPVTMTVDGFANLPLRSAPNTELPAGVLIKGTPYTATYNNTDGALYLHAFYGNPYATPIGGLMQFVGPAPPNSSFVFPSGQAISRTIYATLFALAGTTYGVGDGATTFNVPDLRGRTIIGQDMLQNGAYAGLITPGGSGIDGTSRGARGGAETVTLTTAQMPSHGHGVNDPGHAHNESAQINVQTGTGINVLRGDTTPPSSQNQTASSLTGISIQATGGSAAHNNTQPSIILPMILRVI